MKICFLLSDITKVGGIERVTSTLIGELINISDIEIEIVSIFKGKENPSYPIPPSVKIHYIIDSAHGAKPHSLKRAINMFSQQRKIKSFFKNNEYDLIIIQSFPPALLAYVSGLDSDKIIVAEHVYAGYYGKIVNLIRDKVYKKVKQVVVLTSKDKTFFEKRNLGNKVKVIPNPVLPSHGDKSSCDEPRIISIGRLVYQKGFENLISAFEIIHQHYPSWRLDIYGEGPLKQELTNQIDKSGLSGAVQLKGVSNDIPSELSKSSIFVLSSRFEGFSMVLVEAMNQGVPCVSYDCPNGPSDIVKTGVNGILVEDQNISQLIESIEFLINNEDVRKSYGSQAPDTVKHFSKDLVAQQWINLFNSI